MKLTFLGTRGNIELRSRHHRRHTSTLVSHRRSRVMIDCGADWLHDVDEVRPTAIVITHGHSDHVDGLRAGAPCAVYATADVWRHIETWPVEQRRVVRARESIAIGGLVFEPIPVQHSLRAPAVGYRITSGDTQAFYVPDVLQIPQLRDALVHVALYVGVGASLHRPIQSRQNGLLVGHASVQTQIAWCAETGVSRAIFTHCGTGIVANADDADRRIAAFGQAHGVDASVARDGLQITLR